MIYKKLPSKVPADFLSVSSYARSLGCTYTQAMEKLYKMQDRGLIEPRAFSVNGYATLHFRFRKSEESSVSL